MTIAERNPCPKCHGTPSLAPGIIIPGGAIKDLYLVCWKDDMARRLGTTTWEPLVGKNRKPEWKKFTSTHWQTEVNGEILDYWPTKRKWRYQGVTQTGTVERFIRKMKESRQ